MYNEVLLSHVASPYHMEAMDDADGIGQVGFPGEGPFMIFYLNKGKDGLIESAYFETYGCPSAIGCGSWLCRWVEGKEEAIVVSLQADELMLAVGGLPLGKEHNAARAIEALNYALRECE
ncbi:MAG: iron-sulfur cluster assembly scaffold protein [Proteobacteria bacterium]|nr:MAG: iron-sulfur cluster assembly scaffold protein [Pseudomonadota bacterium]